MKICNNLTKNNTNQTGSKGLSENMKRQIEFFIEKGFNKNKKAGSKRIEELRKNQST
jgi:hypothetical protein